MTQITNDVINNTPSEFNIFLLIKQTMKNGELQISNISSKNRGILHTICAKYNLEHYSIGNYSNRIFVIKDKQHTYFSNVECRKRNINTNPTYLYKFNYKQEEIEEDIKEEIEEEEIEEEDEEYNDTDTYSSETDSNESCSSSSSTNSYILSLEHKFNTLKVFTYANFVLNLYLLISIN